MTTISLDVSLAPVPQDSVSAASTDGVRAASLSAPPADPASVASFQSAMSAADPTVALDRAFAMVREAADSRPSALPQAVASEVKAAFEATIRPLLTENAALQGALAAATSVPLQLPTGGAPSSAPIAEPPVEASTSPVVPQAVAPEVKAAFEATIRPLMTENAALQGALAAATSAPLQLPTGGAPSAAPIAEPTVEAPTAPVVPQAVAPEVKAAFKATIQPLVTENAALQGALAAATSSPLRIPGVEISGNETALAGTVAVSSEAEGAAVANANQIPARGSGAKVASPALKRNVGAQEAAESAQPVDAGQVAAAGLVAPATPLAASVPVETVAAVAAPGQALPTQGEILLATAEAVAETILVTPGLLSGEGEIRVQLKPDVLNGTEIRLNVAGRNLGVEFLPANADVSALIARCLPQLEQHLAAKIHSFAIATTIGSSRRDLKERKV